MTQRRRQHERFQAGGIFSPDPEERAAAALALGEGDDPRALALLVAMLRETDLAVAGAARHALARFSSGPLAAAVREPEVARAWPSPPEHLLRAFVRALRQTHTEARLADSESVAVAICSEVLGRLAGLCAADPGAAASPQKLLFALFGSPRAGAARCCREGDRRDAGP